MRYENNEMNQKIPKDLSPKELHKWLEKDVLQPIIIDVREEEELEMAKFPSTTFNLPLSKFQNWVHTFSQEISIDQPVVVICHSGFRSWNFGTWLIEQDNRYEVWNLVGGIDAWSLEIDQSIPRY